MIGFVTEYMLLFFNEVKESSSKPSLMQPPKPRHKSLTTFEQLHKVLCSKETRSQTARGLVYPQALFMNSMRPTCNSCRQSQNTLGKVGGVGKA